ncbi:MAG: hypothetical protein M1831_007143 [Alyxoria varia]|nr:MAG: hypothetical protein M1831_007143 [Alyxoria varia]
MFTSIAAALAGLFANAVLAKYHVHDNTFTPDEVLRVSKTKISVACTEHETVVVNGTSPGPIVRLAAEKTNWVRVYNDMKEDNTTVHWHGLSQRVAPFSDGTPLASQWPIPPGHYFDYELHPTEKEPGSYFYHSHVGFQTVSATGPLIVEDPVGKAPCDYDEERILFLTELYPRTDEDIVDGLIAAPFVWSGEPQAILVNGHGALSTSSNPLPKECAPEVFEVEPSKTYRFRSIGGLALTDVIIAFEDHADLTIVGADGSYTKPASVDRLQIASGQRFEVLLKTKSKEQLKAAGKKDFWIQLETRYRPYIVGGYALLRYKDAPGYAQKNAEYYPGTDRQALPEGIPSNPPNMTQLLPRDSNDTNNWLEDTLTPASDNGFPSSDEVTRRVYLTNVQLQYDNGQIVWVISNYSWAEAPKNTSFPTAPNDKPYLVDIFERGQKVIPSLKSVGDNFEATKEKYGNLSSGYDPETNAYPAEIGEVLEIILVQEAGYQGTYDVHPWHAHGGHYYDIGSGPGMYDPEENDKKLERLKQEKGYVPALRDSTMLYRWPANNKVNDTLYHVDAWRGWRIRVTDPGVWMIHCHALQHMVMGMQTVWIMGNAQQITRSASSDAQDFLSFGKDVDGEEKADDLTRLRRREVDLDGYLQYGGVAYGNDGRPAVVNHYFGEGR